MLYPSLGVKASPPRKNRGLVWKTEALGGKRVDSNTSLYFQNDQPCLPGLYYTGEQLALASISINLLVALVSFASDLPREATTNPVVVIL